VLIVPGSHFGLEHYIRFGLGMPTAQFREALGRVGETLKRVAVTA
jgi:aspartate/methionine/tyrosine aminotransferase